MSRPEAAALRRPARTGALLLAALLAGCTTNPAPAPGPKALTQPLARQLQAERVAGRAAPAQPSVISYCYSNLLNTPEQLLVRAEETCERANGRLAYAGEDAVLTPCPLLQPVRATWLCYPSEEPEPVLRREVPSTAAPILQ